MFIFIVRLFITGGFVSCQGDIKYFMTFLVIWLVYSVISLIWAISKADAIKNITFLFMGFLVIYFFIYYIKSEADLHKLFKLWIMSFGILIAVGLWEHITGNHLSVSRLFFETRQRYKYAPTGVFYNQNDFATLLALSTPFSIALYRYSNKVFDRICGIIISLLGFYMIIETGSRANIIAALIEIIFIFYF